MACSAHVEKGDVVAISAAVEQPNPDGGWSVNMTRGTVLQGVPTGKGQYLCHYLVGYFLCLRMNFELVYCRFRDDG